MCVCMCVGACIYKTFLMHISMVANCISKKGQSLMEQASLKSIYAYLNI